MRRLSTSTLGRSSRGRVTCGRCKSVVGYRSLRSLTQTVHACHAVGALARARGRFAYAVPTAVLQVRIGGQEYPW